MHSWHLVCIQTPSRFYRTRAAFSETASVKGLIWGYSGPTSQQHVQLWVPLVGNRKHYKAMDDLNNL